MEEWLKDLPMQTENPAFNQEQLIGCAKCARKNPPTRLKCLYCGAELEISESQSNFLKPSLRKLETWEKGFNIIYHSQSQDFDKAVSAQVAKMLRLEKDTLDKLMSAEKKIPLARAESEKEAEIIKKRLQESGVETIIVSDESLATEIPAKRLRGIEFWDNQIILILFNKDEIVEISNEDLILIVTGAIFERKVEAVEKRNRKGENKILETDETASDEFLIDIYNRKNIEGYRIFTKGFDFSSLEAEKEMLAKDNMKKLIQKLCEVAPRVKLVDDYRNLRESLGIVWEVENRSDSQGLVRKSFGNFNLTNITTVSNSLQFTKYSRLQKHLL